MSQHVTSMDITMLHMTTQLQVTLDSVMSLAHWWLS